MSTSRLWLAFGGVAVAFASVSAHAGDFGIRFSYRSTPRCSSYCQSGSYVYCDPAPTVYYRTCAPVVTCDPVAVVRDSTPRVVVYRDYVPRRYYASRKLHHRRAVHRTVYHSYPHGQWNGRYYRYDYGPLYRRYVGGGRHHGGYVGAGFLYRH